MGERGRRTSEHYDKGPTRPGSYHHDYSEDVKILKIPVPEMTKLRVLRCKVDKSKKCSLKQLNDILLGGK